MKKHFSIFMVFMAFVSFQSCVEDETDDAFSASVVTMGATDISNDGFTFHATINYSGGSACVPSGGVYYYSTPNVAGNKAHFTTEPIMLKSGTNNIDVTVDNFQSIGYLAKPGQTIYYCAYAKVFTPGKGDRFVYGEEKSFVLDEGDNRYSAYGFFTITGDLTSGYKLHQDGGGTVIPTTASVSNITGGKGFEGLDIERALLSFTYSDKNVSYDKKTIKNAELTGGNSIDVYTPITKDEAKSKGVLQPDSIFDVRSVDGIWAYRGFITIVNKGYYVLNDKKDRPVLPTLNLVYDPAEQIPDELNLTLCINEHHKKDVTPSGIQEFTTSFRLAPMQFVPGNDSIKVNMKIQGARTPFTIKVARKDLVKGDWQ